MTLLSAVDRALTDAEQSGAHRMDLELSTLRLLVNLAEEVVAFKQCHDVFGDDDAVSAAALKDTLIPLLEPHTEPRV